MPGVGQNKAEMPNYAAPMLCNLLSEMKGVRQRLGLPVLVKGSGYACEIHVPICI
jgi:hypothetical protein